MQSIFCHLRPALVLLLLFTLLFGGIYPALSGLLIRAVNPDGAEGSLIIGKDGAVLGSELIGQNFTQPQYFWGRISATSPMPYNAAASAGSNLGVANLALAAAAKARIDALRHADPENTQPIPADLVTASGSGLDPHISPEAAEYQLVRVAKARGLSPSAVHALVVQYTEAPQWRIFGQDRVHVLKLNLALDQKL
jgi:K+-transporting ATPase ATPase C chain